MYHQPVVYVQKNNGYAGWLQGSNLTRILCFVEPPVASRLLQSRRISWYTKRKHGILRVSSQTWYQELEDYLGISNLRDLNFMLFTYQVWSTFLGTIPNLICEQHEMLSPMDYRSLLGQWVIAKSVVPKIHNLYMKYNPYANHGAGILTYMTGTFTG